MTNTKKETLRVTDLTVGYGSLRVLEGVNFALREGDFAVLLGANGAGKSTLLKTLSSTLTPLSGSITIEGVNIHGAGARQLARLMSIVYTERAVNGGLTVREVVSLGRQPHTGFLGRLSAEDREIVETAIHDVGIDHKADSFLSSISDGERQKAMIARALAQQTPVILLDEPTAFLDVSARFEILDLLKRFTAERGTTVMLSTHDVAPALACATHVLALDSQLHTLTPLLRHDPTLPSALNTLFHTPTITFDPTQGDFISTRR